MGISAWGLLAAPFLAHAQSPAATTEEKIAGDILVALEDPFSALSVIDEVAMSRSSGGASTAINIGDVGANFAENVGKVENTTSNGNNGQISDNIVADNHGITTTFFNSGNGVVFQSIVNVNIFLNNGAAIP